MQELSMHLLDLAQNSIRAGAKLVEIDLDEQPERDELSITLTDDGAGMTPEQLKRVTDPFYTTRETRRVGLGVPLFKMAAEMTGGGLEISSSPGKGAILKARFGLRHIDRMPMGDMAATYCTLVQGNPEIDFVYTHHRGTQSFCIDTRQLRQTLEDIPLNEPEVLAFIGDMIGERIESIQSEL